MSIRFDGRVAIVTGAGAGLGKAYALALAARGAMVVVNDPGVTMAGTGGDASVAEAVVAEIEQAGGRALASMADITQFAQVQAMVEETQRVFGRVDILINNAGILRDSLFAEMSVEDFRKVIDVHVMGSVHTTKAVWALMRAQNYGRIVMTTSSSGLFGSPHQASYATAKAAVIGLMSTLGLEGADCGVHVNAIAPVANSRMSAGHFPGEMPRAALPGYVTDAVLFLCSREAPNRCTLFSALGGFSVVRTVDTPGLFLGEASSAETIRDRFADIAHADTLNSYPSVYEHMTRFNATAIAALR